MKSRAALRSGSSFLWALPCGLVLGGIFSANAQSQQTPAGSQPAADDQPAATEADTISNPEMETATTEGTAPTADDFQRNRKFSFTEDNLAESLFRWGPVSFHPGAGYSVSYNDNVFAGRTGAPTAIKSKDDILHRFALDLAGTFFTGDTDDLTIPRASYQPEFLLYTKNSDRNTVNHAGDVKILKQFSRTSIALDHISSSKEDVFAETATNERQTTHTTKLTVHYELGGKTTLESETSQRLYSSVNFLSTQEWREDIWMNYMFLPKVGAAIGTSGGYATVSEGGASWVHADQVRLTYYSSEKLIFNARGGYEWRFAADEDGRDHTGFIAGLGVDYKVADFTDLSLSAERAMRPSIYLLNETGTYNTVAATVRQLLSRRFFASLTGSFSHVEFDSNPSSRSAISDYDFYSSQIEVGYSITKRARSSVFYRRLGRSGGGGFGDFTSNEVGLNVNYHF